nr:MAG TPA: hypothetical protein [Caudoviricetes sp.]
MLAIVCQITLKNGYRFLVALDTFQHRASWQTLLNKNPANIRKKDVKNPLSY